MRFDPGAIILWGCLLLLLALVFGIVIAFFKFAKQNAGEQEKERMNPEDGSILVEDNNSWSFKSWLAGRLRCFYLKCFRAVNAISHFF